MAQITYDEVNLMLRLYDMRRETSLSWQRMNASYPGPGSRRRSATTTASAAVESLDPNTPSSPGRSSNTRS